MALKINELIITPQKRPFCFLMISYRKFEIAQSGGAVEHTDSISAEGLNPPPKSVLDMT